MVKKCAWGLCNSDSRFPERMAGGVTFIPFPKPRRGLAKCKRWIKACGRPHDQLNVNKADYNRHLFVCTKHFVNGEPSDEYPDPLPASINLSTSTAPTPKRQPPKKRSSYEPVKKKSRKTLDITSSIHDSDSCERTSGISPHNLDHDSNLTTQSLLQDQHTGSSSSSRKPNQTLQQQLHDSRKLLEQQQQVLASQILKNEELRRETKSDTTASPISQPSSYLFNVEEVHNKHSKGSFKYYIGVEYEDYMNIFHFVAPKNELPFKLDKNIKCSKTLHVKDQFFMVLVKLRVNFDFKHLATLFSISQPDCGALFREWINYLYYYFGSLPIWPHRDVLAAQMPDKLKTDFPNTFAILDGTELKVERPSSLRSQSQCYSDYKSATTFKALVSVDPKGSFNFISMLFSDSISDKEITKESGFLQQLKDLIACGKLRTGDGIMLDKGFHITKEIEELGLKLWIPPFAASEKQMEPSQVIKTKKIARHRVIVENAIGRAKKFEIIDQKIEMSLFPSINQIFFVCSFFFNKFYEPLGQK